MDNNINLQNIDQKEEPVDYKALFFKFYRFWYFFALTIFVALVIAFLFNKYSKPIYEAKTTVLIKDDKSSAQNLIGIGFMNSQQNLENEIGILQSYTLTERAVRELNFYISYFHP